MAFDDTWYGTGTASVANGSTTVTGAGSNWLTAGIRQGDFFLAGGDIVPIASVGSQTGITLTDGWPGANRSGASYKIIPAVDGARIATTARDVLNMLTNGNLSSVAALATLANKLAYYTGPGAAALTDLTAAGRALLALVGATGAKIPVVTGVGTAALRDILGTASMSGGVPTGAIIERGTNSNGEYTRWADGTQLCTAAIDATSDAWNTATGSFFYGSGGTWVFPAAFNLTASVRAFGSGLLNSVSPRGVSFTAQSASQAIYRAWAGSSIAAGTAKTLHMQAWGTWA